ncbi:hypothetical protein [Spiroplasma poulsonii]|nr:hypothetical protein [Spiroplasma poulsonii]
MAKNLLYRWIETNKLLVFIKQGKTTKQLSSDYGSGRKCQFEK